ncbi:hypothetical protein QYF61_010934 [Mycteria americana]|uniref:CHM4C protein n=3 Tax=Neoaves TaxID=3078114 RepID=A0AAN7NLP1_MYCAM|nr:hypothetical protein QYF61_010934 [Mycteria americana]
MSKISKFFKGGGSAASKGRGGPSPQEALARLRETEEMLSKKQEYLEMRIERELAAARQHGTKNKRGGCSPLGGRGRAAPRCPPPAAGEARARPAGAGGGSSGACEALNPRVQTPVAALQALKRKKRYEKQLSQIDGTLSTIEFQREALENSHTNTEVLKNMGYAAQAMKKVHENMDLNKIDDLMQDITEQQDVAQEISDAISNRAAFGDEFDEDILTTHLDFLFTYVQGDHGNMDRVKKVKANLEPDLARHVKGNKKGFYKYMISKRKTRETMDLLLNGAGKLVQAQVNHQPPAQP